MEDAGVFILTLTHLFSEGPPKPLVFFGSKIIDTPQQIEIYRMNLYEFCGSIESLESMWMHNGSSTQLDGQFQG